MTPHETMMKTLRFALSMRRPHGGSNEMLLLAYLSQLDPANAFFDDCGNLHLDRRTSRKHRTLFVAHVDTVHRTNGPNVFDDSKPIWIAAGGQPLGADDGAGVALLTGLIAAKVPGYYVFTRGEEVGGVGAKYLVDCMEDLLAEFDHAVAFDRRKTFSVITHQGMGRCCSDTFAEVLCDELNSNGMLYMPDDGGVYTDTAEFTDIIPECTNISVGYEHEHSAKEQLDTEHLAALLNAACAVRWDKLPAERDPTEPDDDFFAELQAQRDFAAWMRQQNGETDDENDPFYVNDNPRDIRKVGSH